MRIIPIFPSDLYNQINIGLTIDLQYAKYKHVYKAIITLIILFIYPVAIYDGKGNGAVY